MLDALPFRFALALGLSLALSGIGCLPSSGTMPTRTYQPEELRAARPVECSLASLEDLHGSLWTATMRAAFLAASERNETSVVSILGCHVELLQGCRAPGSARDTGEVLAKDLEGACTMATHVLRPVGAEGATLSPLSLGDYRLTGTFHGVMAQPNGPYPSYDATMYLAQDGARVTGVTRLSTLRDGYWGDLLFEGQLQGNVLFFRDASRLDDNLPFWLEWCTKGGYLIVDPRDGHLSGPWRAPMCAPGTLDMRRIEDHPRVRLPVALRP